MAIEFARAHPPDPGLPGGRRLRPRRRHGDAGLQRVAASRRCRRVVEAAQRRPRRRRTAIPIRPTSALRQALSDRYGVPPERIALGNGSCDILLAAGEALLEPGAEVVYAWPAFSVYPHLAAASGARAIEVPLDAEDRHDLDAMAAEITVATRLVLICNPNNPTSTVAAARRRSSAVPRAGPAPRVRDPRRGLLRVRAGARRHLRLGRAAAPPPEPRAAADVLQGLRAGRAAGRLRAVRVRGLPRRRRPGPPAVLPQHGRAGRRRGGAAPPGRGGAPGHPHASPRARSSSDGLRGLGLWVAESDANFVWTHLPADAVEADSSAGSPTAGCWSGPGPPLGREGSLRVTLGTDAENERFLDAIGELV